MPDHPTSYLVLASQRCGSTLLVESLRATGSAGEPQEFFQYLPTTGMAPQPRQWFADVEDETILDLLDPAGAGHAGYRVIGRLARAHPQFGPDAQRRLGRQADVEPDAAAASSGRRRCPIAPVTACGRPSATSIGSEPVYVHVHRPDVVSQAVSFWRAVQTRVWRGRPDPRARLAGLLPRRCDRPRRRDAARARGCWRAWFADEGIEPIDVPYPVLWRNLTTIVGDGARGARAGSPAGSAPGTGAPGRRTLR